MAIGNGLEYALRIKPDLDQAGDALHALEQSLDTLKAAGKSATDTLSQLGGNVDQITATGQAAGRAATEIQRQAESAEATSERLRAMVQASLEYKRALDAQIEASRSASDESSRSVTATAAQAEAVQRATQAAYESQAAISAQMRSIGELHDRIERGVQSYEDLAHAEMLLDQAMRTGMVSEQEQLELLAKLDAQEKQLVATRQRQETQLQQLLRAYDPASGALKKLEEDEAKLKKAMDEGRLSIQEYERAMVSLQAQRTRWSTMSADVDRATQSFDRLKLSAREVRTSLAAASRQALRGNFSGVGNTLLGLGTRAAPGFGAAGLAIGGVTAAIAALTVTAYRGHQEVRSFETGIIASGNSAGVAAGQIADMRNRVGDAAQAYTEAQRAGQLLLASGRATSDTIEAMMSGAVNLAKLTGDSIDSTTAKIIQLADAPSQQLAKLNESYHFLTLGVYEHVKSLEEQGKMQDAARVAVEEFDRVHRIRIREAADQAGLLERRWAAVKSAVLSVLQAMKDVGRQDLDAENRRNADRLRRLEDERTRIEVGAQRVLPWQSRDKVLSDLDEEIKRQRFLAELSESALARREKQLEAEAAAQRVQDEGVAAAARVGQILEQGKSKTEQLREATKKLAEEYRAIREANPDSGLLAGVTFGVDGSVSGGSYDRAARALQERYKERGSRKKSEEQRAAEAARRELDNLQKQIALLGELQEGEKKVAEAARIRYEITSGAYAQASDALKKELLDHAQLLDTERMRIEANKQLAEAQRLILQLQGKFDPQTDKQLRELQQVKDYLDGIGRDADSATVTKALGLVEADAKLRELRVTYDTVMRQIELETQRINIELRSGLLTEAGAQERVVALYRQKSVVLREIVPQMRAMAEALENEQALANVRQIELHLQEMANATDLIQQRFSSVYQGSISDGLMSLVKATDSLQGAVEGFFLSVAQGMADFVARDWAQQLANWTAKKLFKKAADATTETSSATAAATAAAPILGGGIKTGAVSGAATLATALDAAFVRGALKIAAAISAGSAGDLAKDILKAATGKISKIGFAAGGWTGPGGKYTPAGIVHANEFVHRSEVVRQPGALSFLSAFNRYGMAALTAWRGYADGGLVTPLTTTAPPRFTPSESRTSGGPFALNNTMHVTLDYEALSRMMRESGMIEAEVKRTISLNPNFIKAQLS